MKTTSLVILSLLSFSFLIGLTASQGVYDVWYDFDDDGDIDIFDIVDIAGRYGTTGKPFNKTAALLELAANVGIINAIIVARVPQSEIISIPAAAFVPAGPSVSVDEWLNTGNSIRNLNDTHHALFHAPVQLPHGVTITRVTCYWDDASQAVDIFCRLFRGNQTYHMQEMVNLDSFGSSGHGSSVSTTINYATIDNLYQYYMSVMLYPELLANYYFQYAIIEYQYPA